MEKAGYGATLITQDRPADTDDGRVRDLWRRLVVALLLGVPLADLSITLVVVPSLRFPGWQWLLLAMTLPVVGWSAWPFHRKAVIAARHGGSSMDTLVSLGIIAASCWSMYTIFHDQPATGSHGGWGLIFQPGGSIYRGGSRMRWIEQARRANMDRFGTTAPEQAGAPAAYNAWLARMNAGDEAGTGGDH